MPLYNADNEPVSVYSVDRVINPENGSLGPRIKIFCGGSRKPVYFKEAQAVQLIEELINRLGELDDPPKET